MPSPWPSATLPLLLPELFSSGADITDLPDDPAEFDRLHTAAEHALAEFSKPTIALIRADSWCRAGHPGEERRKVAKGRAEFRSDPPTGYADGTRIRQVFGLAGTTNTSLVTYRPSLPTCVQCLIFLPEVILGGGKREPGGNSHSPLRGTFNARTVHVG